MIALRIAALNENDILSHFVQGRRGDAGVLQPNRGLSQEYKYNAYFFLVVVVGGSRETVRAKAVKGVD